MLKILRKSQQNREAQFPKLGAFDDQKPAFRHYCIRNVKDGIQMRVYKINDESATNFGQFISVKV